MDDGTSSPGADVSGVALDAEHPWPGPAAYDEASSAFFHGRTVEAAELLRLIRAAPHVSLYGRSGLGKSSLLQAGLFPQLRAANCLPVYVRIDFSVAAADAPLEQIAQKLDQALAAPGIDAPRRAASEPCWQYLHRRDFEIWSSDNFLLTPVFVLDQFEELFSRGGPPERIRAICNELGDLIENRIPPALATDRERCKALDLLTQRYRVLLSFREDYLPEIQGWKPQVPSLLRHELRLLPMGRDQAIEAAERAGEKVLAPGAAAQIVDFIAARDSVPPGLGAATDTASQTPIEPVLLSLCCTQLNARRPPGGVVDAALLESAGADILHSFYRDALANMPDRVARFIETDLIQGRYRGSYPRDEALERGVITADELAVLTDRFRLLRIDPQPDAARIELIHDRLVGVVNEARAAREAHEQAQAREAELHQQAQVRESELRRAAERERALQAEREARRVRRWLNRAVAAALVALGFAGLAIWQAQLAQHSSRLAQESSRHAHALRLILESQAMLSGGVADGSDTRAYQQLLTAYQLEPNTVSQGRLLEALLARQHLRSFTPQVFWEDSDVIAVTYSPDGRWLATGHGDGNVVLRDATTRLPVRRMNPKHDDIVQGLAFSADSTRLLSASNDGTARQWSVADGKPIGPVLKHDGAVYSAGYNPGGSRIVTGGADGLVKLWDAATGTRVGADFEIGKAGDSGIVWGVAFHPDGQRVGVASDKPNLILFDTATRKADTYFANSNGVMALAFSRDRRFVATGGRDRIVRSRDLFATTPTVARMTGHTGDVQSVAFSPDSRFVASGSEDHTVRLWDAATGVAIGRPLEGHAGGVTSVAFSIDGRWLVSGGEDRSFRLWPTDLSRPIGGALAAGGDKPASGNGLFASAVFSSDGSRVIATALDGRSWQWDAATRALIASPAAGQEYGSSAGSRAAQFSAWSADGRFSVIVDAGGQLQLRDNGDGTLRALQSPTSSTPVGGNGGCKNAPKQTAARRQDDAQNNSADISASASDVRDATFSADDKLLVTAHQDGRIRLWDTATARSNGELSDGQGCAVVHVALSADGHRLASAGAGKDEKLLWDLKTKASTKLPRLNANEADAVATALAFSPDGKRLIVTGEDRHMHVWELKGGALPAKPLLVPEGQGGFVTRLVFSPDGRTMIAAANDGTLRLWDMAGAPAQIGAPLEGPAKPLTSISFSPDGGKRIVSLGEGGDLRLWPAPATWQPLMCAKLDRNMSRQQWREWVATDLDYTCQCPSLPIAPDDGSAPAAEAAACGEALGKRRAASTVAALAAGVDRSSR